MTLVELKQYILDQLAAPVTVVQKIINVFNAVVDHFTGNTVTSIIPDWAADLTFQTDGTGSGKFCIYADTNGKKRIFETKTDDNINNAPPSNPTTTENTYWLEISQAGSSAIVEWEPKLYGAGLVIVYHTHSVDGAGLYRLLEPTRPFNSTNIETEITANQWECVGANKFINLGQNTTLQSLADASDEHAVALLTKLGVVFRSDFLKYNETLKQLILKGSQCIWSAYTDVTNGNFGIKVLEAASEAFKVFDNIGNYISVGVDSTKRVVRVFTALRHHSGVSFNETEFISKECLASVTTALKTITMPIDTIMTVDITNLAVHNVDQDCIFGHAQFTFKNDGGTITDLSQDELRYDRQYSTIGTDGYVTNAVTRIDASISGTDVTIDLVNTVAKHTICQFEIKYNIVTLPVAP